MSDEIRRFIYTDSEQQRLDKFLVSQLSEFSRSRLQGLVKDGFVRVNGKQASKGGQVVEAGDEVEIRLPPPEPSTLIPEDIPIQVIYEDQRMMVINKPAGMVVHPAAGHATGTLVHAALAHSPELEGVGGVQRPGVVHRLDKDTSGLIIMAKNDRAHRWLQEQFRLRKVQKTYIALVDGQPPTPSGRVEASIGRSQTQRKKMAVVSPEKGREAISEYLTLEQFPDHTLLEVHPLTGRTHQIRIHMAFLGCPIVADTVYGHRHPSLPIKRHFLHAARLILMLPGEKEARRFEAPLPNELEIALDNLRQHTR